MITKKSVLAPLSHYTERIERVRKETFEFALGLLGSAL